MIPGPERSPFVETSRKAAGIKDGSIPVESLLPPTILVDRSQYEAEQIYANRKTDVYALMGVYVALLVDSADRESRSYPPLGLSLPGVDGSRVAFPADALANIYKDNGFSPFSYVNMSLRDQLFRIRNGIFADGKTTKLFQEVKEASEKWGEFYDVYIPPAPFIRDIDGVGIRNTWNFVNPAIINAVNFMTGMASLVPEVIESTGFDPLSNNTTPGEILEESFYIPQAFASTGIEQFSHGLKRIIEIARLDVDGQLKQEFPDDGRYFDPDVFSISRSETGKWRLGLSSDLMPERNPDALKCPALINVLGESAIKKLWRRTVQPAKVLYPKMHAAEGK